MILLIGGVLILTAVWLFIAAWMPSCDCDLPYPIENVEPTTDNPWRAVMTPASHLYRLPASPAAANSRATTDDGSSKGR